MAGRSAMVGSAGAADRSFGHIDVVGVAGCLAPIAGHIQPLDPSLSSLFTLPISMKKASSLAHERFTLIRVPKTRDLPCSHSPFRRASAFSHICEKAASMSSLVSTSTLTVVTPLASEKV